MTERQLRAGPAARPGRRPRIAHVIAGLSTGGAETTLRTLAAGLADRYDARILSLTDAGRPDPALAAAGVEVAALGWERGRFGLAGFTALAARLARFDPHLVQGWMYHANLAGWAAVRCLGPPRPVVWNIRYTPAGLAGEKLLTAWTIRFGALVADRPAAVVFNARASVERHRELGYAPRRAVLIENGFDLERFRPDAEARRRARALLAIAPGATAVGLVGRWDPIKGHRTFLAAARMLGSPPPGTVFVLAGPGVDAANSELAGEIAAQGMADRVRLAGEWEDVPALMTALDVACLASYSEAFPNVVGEAMACEVPCVVTAVGDAPRLVGETGVVVPPRDVGAFAAGLARLLDAGPEGRRRLGAAARERIRRHFALPAMLERYDRLYREVLAGR